MIDSSTKISICMGSSCYARGNARNAEIVQTWLAARAPGQGLELELTGTLCEGRCKEGPIVAIGERVLTGVKPEAMLDILAHLLPPGERA